MRNVYKLCCLLALFFTNQSSQAQNLALTATATHSGGGATTYDASNYNDNVIANCGSTSTWGWVTSNGWIEYTWTTPQNLFKVIFYKDSRPMTSCTIEYWNGTGYSTIMTYSNSVSCLDSVTFPTVVTTTRLRFNTVAGSNPNHREIQVYGVPCSTEITKHPISVRACEATNTTFSITAQDVTNYKWQINSGSGYSDIANSTIYNGATTDNLALSNLSPSLNGAKFRAIVAKSVCADTSDEVTLNVDGLLKMEPFKAKDTTCLSSTKDITIKGTGSITEYKWQVFVHNLGFIDVPQAPPYSLLGNTLRITNVPDTLDGGRFRVIVNGICDTMMSNEVELEVEPIPYVGVSPEDITVQQGTNVRFTVEATAAGARYIWQVATPEGQFVNVNDGGIYQGTRTDRLTVRGASRAFNGFRFRCVVLSPQMCNAPGDTSDFAVLTVEQPAGISNLNSTVEMMVYPNPSNASDVFIYTDANIVGRDVKYRVMDKTGRTILSGDVTEKTTRVDISALPADLYLVQLTDAGKMIGNTKFTRL